MQVCLFSDILSTDYPIFLWKGLIREAGKGFKPPMREYVDRTFPIISEYSEFVSNLNTTDIWRQLLQKDKLQSLSLDTISYLLELERYLTFVYDYTDVIFVHVGIVLETRVC